MHSFIVIYRITPEVGMKRPCLEKEVKEELGFTTILSRICARNCRKCVNDALRELRKGYRLVNCTATTCFSIEDEGCASDSETRSMTPIHGGE